MGILSRIINLGHYYGWVNLMTLASGVLGLAYGVKTALSERSPREPRIDELRLMTNLNKMCRACIHMRQVCPRGELECSYAILRWIVDFLNSAEESIDAAIYLVTCSEFKDAFINAHNRGVKIRFISDYNMSGGTGSAIPHLRAAGIVVRTSSAKEYHMMHRKSVIVDRKCVLSGTGNWTMQSLCGNWDGFVKTNDPVGVQSFMDAFEHEWELYNPIEVKDLPCGNPVA